MNTVTVKAVVLQRTDFGEADRILVVLTDTAGVVHVLAKGVRRIKSKLAGGIELFAVNELTLAKSRGDLQTLVSARMQQVYGAILHDIERTMLGYELLRFLYKQLEHEAGPEYFDLLTQALAGLQAGQPPLLVRLWFYAQFMTLSGMQPDLQHDVTGGRLKADGLYAFNSDEGRLQLSPHGSITADHIKLMRFICSQSMAAASKLRIPENAIVGCEAFIRHIRHTQ